MSNESIHIMNSSNPFSTFPRAIYYFKKFSTFLRKKFGFGSALSLTFIWWKQKRFLLVVMVLLCGRVLTSLALR